MPRPSNHRVAADRSDHQYFTVTPHLVLALCRDPYEFMLWSVIKTVAGDNECMLSARDLARLCGCGVSKIVAARTYLLEAGLLTGEIARDPDASQPVWHLAVPDLWHDNSAWRVATGHGWKAFIAAVEAVRDAQKGSPGEASSLKKEVKEVNGDIPMVELGNRTLGEVTELLRQQLRLQMTRATYDTWLSSAICTNCASGQIEITVMNTYARDWLTLRLQPMVRRALASILGKPIEVFFVVKPLVPQEEQEEL